MRRWAADEAERDGSLPQLRRSLESSLDGAEEPTFERFLKAELVRREAGPHTRFMTYSVSEGFEVRTL